MKKNLIPLIAFAAVLALNLYFRLFPAYFPQLKQLASENVLKSARDELVTMARRNFPSITPRAQERIAEAQYEQYIRDNATALERKINNEYLAQKDRYQDKRGQTYLMELDCWHWARYVANVVHLGHSGDKVIAGKQFDTRMMAPDGSEMPYNQFLFYASAWLYKFVNRVVPLPLEQFLFYLPLLFMAALLAALFFFCMRFYGLVCAFVSCLFVGMAPIFMPRSIAGWFDMDILSMLFPLVCFIGYLSSFERRGVRKLMWIAFAAVCMGVFAFTWSYWFVFVAIIMAYEGYIMLNLLSEHFQYKTPVAQEAKVHAVTFTAFSALTVLCVFLFCGSAPFKYMVGQISVALNLNDATTTVWPNIFATVGELKRPDFMTICVSTGDSVLFCIGLVAMLTFLLFNQRFNGVRRESILLFVMWFLAMFLISFKGVRFVMFLLIPLGVFLGWGMEELFAWAEKKRNWVIFILCTAGLTYVCFSCINAGYKSACSVFPLIDDRWYSLLTTIKQETPPDSVINSWWDFGDWFETAAARPAVFDGQSQNGTRAYWMAKVLLAEDEVEAVNILRMLNNGGNKVFEILEKHFRDPVRALEATRDIVCTARRDAKEKLSGILSAKDARRVEALIFDAPMNKGYFIVDSSMLMKMPAISFIGNWDAVKVYVSENIQRRSIEDIKRYLTTLGVSSSIADNLLLEASVTPHNQTAWLTSLDYFYGSFDTARTEDGLVFFSNGSVYNPVSGKLYLYDAMQRSFGTPQTVLIYDGNHTQDTGVADSTIAMTAVVMKESDGYQLMLFSPQLAKSIFFRLFFLHGRGCEHFKPFAEEKDLASVYEIVW